MKAITTATTVRRIQQHGIVIPRIAIGVADKTHLELAVGCAFLMRETGGGYNIFGHDPTIYAGAGVVTKAKYLAYKALRKRTGMMQGVGAGQLTWYSYQDAADALGGCWEPKYNVQVAFQTIAHNIRSYGSLWAGAYHYNGSGPAAVAYANAIVQMTYTWRQIIAGRRLTDELMETASNHARLELEQAREAHPDAFLIGTQQSYLPKIYCWEHKSIQAATSQLPVMEKFLHDHPYMRAFSGLRPGEEGDHRCGFALDVVPLTTDAHGYRMTQHAHADALRAKFSYVEPLSQTWYPGNHHLHISFRRCP